MVHLDLQSQLAALVVVRPRHPQLADAISHPHLLLAVIAIPHLLPLSVDPLLYLLSQDPSHLQDARDDPHLIPAHHHHHLEDVDHLVNLAQDPDRDHLHPVVDLDHPLTLGPDRHHQDVDGPPRHRHRNARREDTAEKIVGAEARGV